MCVDNIKINIIKKLSGFEILIHTPMHFVYAYTEAFTQTHTVAFP